MANEEMKDTLQGAGDTAPYVLRSIKAPDVFQLVRVLSKIGLAEISKSLDAGLVAATRFEPPMKMAGDKMIPMPESMWTAAAKRAKEKAETAKSQLSMQILGVVIENLPNCEYELYTLLASSINEPIEYIQEMDATTFLYLIDDYISRDGFTDFFGAAVKLLSNSRQKIDLPI